VIRIGNAGIAADLRTWVNQGLMTLFFLVVGLEAKRQLDLGELRERRRLAIPVFGALGGIIVPVAIYLAFNAGRAGGHGWGAAMSTDTAFALAAVALVTPRTATRIRVFLLTLAVVDDLAALLVIATVYTTHVSVLALIVAWIASRPALHGPRSPISEPVLLTAGACAGIGFTVSLLVSSLAFTGLRLDQARLGALATVIVAPALAWATTRIIRRLPDTLRARQIARTAQEILDLTIDVDPEHDHIRGPDDAPVTLVEYGDFECPYCGQAESVIRELLAARGDDVRYVWRHLPLNDVHPGAQTAAVASEAAAAQGKFWEMYDVLLSHQGDLTPKDLVRYAGDLGVDVGRFTDELRRSVYVQRVSRDVASADESGVSGTPTFFINGRRHYGVYDLDTLTEAITAAKTRARQLAATTAAG